MFAAACREPFLRLALPLFGQGQHQAPLARQPGLVVDAGCGDGPLPEARYHAVRERTAIPPALPAVQSSRAVR